MDRILLEQVANEDNHLVVEHTLVKVKLGILEEVGLGILEEVGLDILVVDQQADHISSQPQVVIVDNPVVQ